MYVYVHICERVNHSVLSQVTVDVEEAVVYT